MRPAQPLRRYRYRRRSASAPQPRVRTPPGRGEQCLLASAPSVSAVVLKRPHFDWQRDGTCKLASPLERCIQIGCLNDVETAEVLLAFDVRAVGRQHLAVFE